LLKYIISITELLAIITTTESIAEAQQGYVNTTEL